MEAVLGQEGKERLIKRVSMAPWAPVEGFFVTYNPSLITQIICLPYRPRREPTNNQRIIIITIKYHKE